MLFNRWPRNNEVSCCWRSHLMTWLPPYCFHVLVVKKFIGEAKYGLARLKQTLPIFLPSLFGSPWETRAVLTYGIPPLALDKSRSRSWPTQRRIPKDAHVRFFSAEPREHGGVAIRGGSLVLMGQVRSMILETNILTLGNQGIELFTFLFGYPIFRVHVRFQECNHQNITIITILSHYSVSIIIRNDSL